MQACLSMCGLNEYQTLKGYQKKINPLIAFKISHKSIPSLLLTLGGYLLLGKAGLV